MNLTITSFFQIATSQRPNTEYEALDLCLTDITCYLMRPFAATFSHIETSILLLLCRPTATSFRMFPPKEAAFVSWMEDGDLTAYHAWSAWMLLTLVPMLVHYNRKHLDSWGLSRLMRALWRRSRLAAIFLCVMRVWLVLASWNHVLVKDAHRAMAHGQEYLTTGPLETRHRVLLFLSFWFILN
ncbi:hypothetical protein CONLIGDRAFT_331072 [Coniochaeta ligniaria NRRL 30616]|uniref:Uncharacterized protein n=1 Tax=Coniochaeta ligniaria NRRL 30616 TaxID=1408157 RepID=A0A1J7IQ64_9PEZI|nr:hypothetical protein CONLIGDRAFT_331072 [Coniochaeta ligniaria NRRL 30616]